LCNRREEYLDIKATRQYLKESIKFIKQQKFINKLFNLKDIYVACCFDKNYNAIYIYSLKHCVSYTTSIFEDIKYKLLTLIRKEKLLKLDCACFNCFTS
jgi:hypothetical protein